MSAVTDVEQMTVAELQALLLRVKDRVDELLAEREEVQS